MDDGARLLGLLWERYARDVPYAATFTTLAGTFTNDHVAFRSIARRGGGVDALARVFERLGWARRGAYDFPDAHLRAVHLSKDGAPRVFLSALDVDALPADARTILTALPPDPPPPDDVVALADWFAAPPAPSAADLRVVDAASQYGAWVLAFGRRVNHFTASVDDVVAWADRLRAAGVPMKDDVEGEPGGPLVQTATHAALVDVPLREGGVARRPYAYLEIAARRPGFDGFLAPQARALFDMTRAR